EWMRERLQAIGLRPINNVVDITNYVLHETGHPLHAFDRKNLEGDCIKVRFAKKGEKAVTLEEENIQLRPEDLLITDGTSAVALAGVMGCLNSGVSESSEDLVLESACFNASRIRATRKHHDMSTDSSYRFERQADFEMTDFASSRASRLILDIAGGRLSRAVTDLKPEKPEEKVILLRRSRVKTLLGLDLDCGKLANLLLRFQIPSEVEGDDLRVKVPSFRRDLLEEIDLIEEVARLYGYGSLPEENLQSNQMHSSKSKREKLRDRIHRAMTGLSFTELMTSSFMDERSLDQMKLPAEDPRRSLVTLRNPLVSFNEKMRSSLLPGMLDVLKLNVHRDEDQLRLYQLSRVYLAGEEKLPEEPEHLSLLATGLRAPEHWSEKSKAFDSSDLLGITLSLFRSLGVPVSVEYESGESFFAPGQGFRIIGSEGARLGEGGLLRASLLSDLKQKLTIYWMDLSLEKILEEEHSHPAHQEIPSYPPLRRDLALILPESLRWEAVEKVIKEKGGKSLENLYLFDVYSGRGIPEGTRSCAVRLRFRSKDGTLQDEKVDRQIRKILKTLKDTLGVDLRS
ncbi:MAG: phenylalanine--tRNA ligase subunit beta, partial [Candidatus Krumholzibacteria bacterium]|nr:phenylalanine--tRNA ligase subunit beta [Candidatus Krumholzibacteria bacterium]